MKAVVITAGGHARVVASALRGRRGLQLVGFTDADPKLWGSVVNGLMVLGGDDKAGKPGSVALFNGLGGAANTDSRRKLYQALRAQGHRFPALVAPSAVVDQTVLLADGCQILTRAVVHPGASIGENAVVNTAAVIEHDCVVAAHAFVAPGAIMLGGAKLGQGAFLGAAAVLLPGVRVGAGAVVAAGAIVLEDVAPRAMVAGVPARKL